MSSPARTVSGCGNRFIIGLWIIEQFVEIACDIINTETPGPWNRKNLQVIAASFIFVCDAGDGEAWRLFRH
jgi:hypothetical protein